MSKQIKSKQRVAERGEVFTSEREVNAMLDLVLQETQRIESRFLEPACGDGNFLAAVLERKLCIVEGRYKRNQKDYENYAILALSSIYGIDIMEDNVKECQERLHTLWMDNYKKIYKKKIKEEVINVARYILSKNIVCGNALDMKQSNGEPIVLSEWSMILGGKMKRRDFEYITLLSDNSTDNIVSHIEDAFIPRTLNEFPAKQIVRLVEDE